MQLERVQRLNFATICTGIGGMDLGLEQAGLEMLWMCETDEPCRTVLRKQFPGRTIFSDMLELTGKEPRPDVLAAGTPCQGFSFAGDRMSLADSRSNLCLNFVQLCDLYEPTLIVWENVPGVLSLPDNAFGCLIGGLAGTDSPLVPPRTIQRWKPSFGGEYFSWPSAGVVIGPRRMVCWRVLDSQYFGLAQRRERVFVVADSGTGCCEKILFESEMLRRHCAPSRSPGERVAPTVEGRAGRSGENGFNTSGGLIPETVGAINSGAHRGNGLNGQDAYTGRIIPAERRCYTEVTSEGWKESEGTWLAAHEAKDPHTVVIGFEKGRGEHTGAVSGTLRTNSGKNDGVNDGKADNQCVAFHQQQDPITGNEVSPCLGSGGSKSGQSSVAVAYGITDDETASEELLPTMPTPSPSGGGHPPAVAFQPGNLARNKGTGPQEELSPALSAENDGDTKQCVAGPGMAVRRLTPTECERLQGFPDGWTLHGLTTEGKAIQQKDSPRYRQLGNAVSTNVMKWLGIRIRKYAYREQ